MTRLSQFLGAQAQHIRTKNNVEVNKVKEELPAWPAPEDDIANAESGRMSSADENDLIR